MNIGERIRWLRKQRNMTIENLADKVGVTRQTISRYETGVIEDIPKNKLKSVAEALCIPCDYLQGLTIESQRDALQYDILKQKNLIISCKSDEERSELEHGLEVLEESYDDYLLMQQLQDMPLFQKDKAPLDNRHPLKEKVQEWHSDRNSTLSMKIDSWLLLALKGMAFDANKSLTDEIESALYEYVMIAIERKIQEEDGKFNSQL